MSPPRQTSAGRAQTGGPQESGVSAGLHLPPLPTVSSSTQIDDEQRYPTPHHPHRSIYHQRYQPHEGTQPRFTPSVNRTMSSSSSSSPRPPRVSSIQDILNDDSSSADRSTISSTSGSTIASPTQGYSRIDLNLPAMDLSMSLGSERQVEIGQSNLDPLSLRQSTSTAALPALAPRPNRDADLMAFNLSQTGGVSAQTRARMKLVIRQQPQAARACGLGERDRRVIDPPPILQLLLEDFDSQSQSDKKLLESPFNLVTCHLIASGDDSVYEPGQDVSIINDPNDPKKELRRLMGQIVISPFITQNLHIGSDREETSDSETGCYYIFSDLSCRQNGCYRLRFVLMPVSPAVPVGDRVETGHTVESEEFMVYNAKDFPGMLPSSELTKKLKNLGASVPIKKGNENRKTSRKRLSDNSDGSGNDD